MQTEWVMEKEYTAGKWRLIDVIRNQVKRTAQNRVRSKAAVEAPVGAKSLKLSHVTRLAFFIQSEVNLKPTISLSHTFPRVWLASFILWVLNGLMYCRCLLWLAGMAHNWIQKTIKASDTLEHQPPVWPVPYACAQPYHPGSDSHGLSLVRPDQHNIAMRMRKFLAGPWDGVRVRHFLLLFVT